MGIQGRTYSGSKRVMIFIDGGYIRRQIKEFFGDDNLNYNSFISDLKTKSLDGDRHPELIRAFYYDASINMKEMELWAKTMGLDDIDWEEIERKRISQEEYLDKIRGRDFLHVKEGSLVLSGNGGFRQKGVDSLIAIDMITKAYQNQYDEAILVAGDRDFVNVVEAVKHVGPIVAGAYFDDHISRELKLAFDKRHIITKGEIGNYRINLK